MNYSVSIFIELFEYIKINNIKFKFSLILYNEFSFLIYWNFFNILKINNIKFKLFLILYNEKN